MAEIVVGERVREHVEEHGREPALCSAHTTSFSDFGNGREYVRVGTARNRLGAKSKQGKLHPMFSSFS